MDSYEIHTRLSSGKHEGFTLGEVVEIEPEYISELVLLNDIYIDDELIDLLGELNPKGCISLFRFPELNLGNQT